MYKLWEGDKFSFPIGIGSTYAYVLLSIYTPLPLCAHFMEGLWSCIWWFFLDPENLDTIKHFKLVTFFILFVTLPSPPHLLHPLPLPPILPPSCKPRNWFCYQFEQIFRNNYQYFQIYTAFFKISAHWKAGSRRAAPISLHQTYCFICFYSYAKFYCPKVRWSWVLWGKKVLFHVI